MLSNMFFRVKKSPSGQVLQLLESFRNAEGKPTHRVVVSLGNADIPGPIRPLIAKCVETRLYGQPMLLESLDPDVQHWVEFIVKRVDRIQRWRPRSSDDTGQPQLPSAHDQRPASPEIKNCGEVAPILIDQIEHTHTTVLGPTLLALKAWEQLDMPELLQRLGFNQAQRNVAAASVINRLVDPGSEYFIHRQWLANSSLPDLLGEELLNGGKERFYRVSDKLLANHDALEANLRNQTAAQFGLNRTVLLYDLTNTHFEGDCRGNAKAKRGKSKQKRSDCPLVVVGMIFDEYGFALGHRTFAGNQSDSASLPKMVDCLESICTDQELPGQVLVVVDGGIATAANLKLLRQSGYHYLVNESRSKRAAFAEEFNADGFEVVPDRNKNGVPRPSVEVKVIDREFKDDADSNEQTAEPYEERVILCRSQARRQKEVAIFSNAEQRFIKQLDKLQKRLTEGRLKQEEKIHQAVGRLKAKNPRVARFYDITATVGSADQPASLHWQRKTDQCASTDELFGCYVLRTDYQGLTADEYWQLYIGLTNAEDGFRVLKSDLGLRPNYHQIEERVDGHIFITILAYHLLQYILHTLRLKGDMRSWYTLSRVLSTHCYSTLLLPSADGKLYRIRKPGQPETAQRDIYRHFPDIETRARTSRSIIPRKQTKM